MLDDINSQKPIIALFGSRDANNGNMNLRPHYTDAIIHSGAVPLAVPFCMDYEQLCRIADISSGFFFTGGGDVAPNLYGEQKLPFCGTVDDIRDSLELLAFDIAVKRNMPIFGICRGIQLINVAMGGTLYQDITSQTDKHNHQQTEITTKTTHNVKIMSGILHDILQNDEIMTNSFHHQAIKNVANGLDVCAYSEDGIIEAVSSPLFDFLLGVQWHPEFMFENDINATRLFDAFVVASKKYSKRILKNEN